MDEANGEVPRFRGVFRDATRDEARGLDEVDTLLQRFDEARDGVRVVLVVAVDGDDAFVTLVEDEGVGAAQLGAEFARRGLDQQAAYADLLQGVQGQRAVGAAAIDNRSGELGAKAGLDITAAVIDNAQGKLLSEGNAKVIAKAGLDNTGGTIAANSNLEVDTRDGTLTNTGGTLAAGEWSEARQKAGGGSGVAPS